MNKNMHLITRLQAGDPHVLDTITDLYFNPLYYAFKSPSVNYQDFEEWFNTALLQVWQLRKNFEHNAAVYTYLFRVLQGHFVDALRHLKSGKHLPLTSLEAIEVADDQTPTPLSDAQQASEELFAYLYQCIEALPDRQKAVIKLVLQRCTTKEIAAALNLNEATVRVQKANAIIALRKKIIRYGGPDAPSRFLRLGLLLWLYLFLVILKKIWPGS